MDRRHSLPCTHRWHRRGPNIVGVLVAPQGRLDADIAADFSRRSGSGSVPVPVPVAVDVEVVGSVLVFVVVETWCWCWIP